MDQSFIINQYAEDRENYFNAIAPPLVQTSNFAFPTVDAMRTAFENEYGGYLYSRGLNPTVEILRKKLAALDGAEDCLLFNSGAAAIFAAVISQVKNGDHIVSVANPYSWAQNLFDEILPRFGISTTYVDGKDIENFERAILPNTRLIYLESPNSWDFELQDLKAVAELAVAEGIVTICDNSYCSPIYQQPAALGIQLVLQSATKYISGHSDTLGGVLSGSKSILEKIFNHEYLNIGSGIQPFNDWLLLRGLRTLPMRLKQISTSASTIIEYLETEPLVEKVIYPFHQHFPQYQLAKKQMQGAGGLFSFVLRCEKLHEIEKFCEQFRHVLMAVSWGGHESLIIPGCAGIQKADFDPKNQKHRMCRFYTGLEDAAYLIEDFKQAFASINR